MENKDWTYEDIVGLPAHESKVHRRMSLQERAAQFSPFAALTGYDDVIKETARLTGSRAEIDQERLDSLNNVLGEILERLPERIPVKVVHFVKDKTKAGGEYLTREGRLKDVDLVGRILKFDDGFTVGMDDVFEISII